jgi:asparagine synthase (glutamine-hydrolysing)
MFGSELKALRAYLGCSPRVAKQAAAASMRHNYVPAPYTIYEGVYKFEPGRHWSRSLEGPRACLPV